MCEWILILALLKILLRILSEWFPKHLEISLGAIPRGFESLPLRQLVASDISLVTSFFISLQSSSRAHSAAPRFQTEPASLGFGLGS